MLFIMDGFKKMLIGFRPSYDADMVMMMIKGIYADDMEVYDDD